MNATFARTLPPGGLVEHLASLLGALYRGCRGAVVATVGRGTAAQEYRTQAADLGGELQPGWLLRELVYAPVDEIRLGLASMHGSGDPADAGALWVEIPREAVFGTAPSEGWAWRVPPEIVGAVDARLAAFPVPPAIVVDAENLTVVWLLDRPARLDDPAERARVEHLQRALAAALGGRLDDVNLVPAIHSRRALGDTISLASWPAWHPARPAALPLPGSTNRERGNGLIVVLDHLDVSRRVTLDDIETALTLPSTTPKKGRTHAHA